MNDQYTPTTEEVRLDYVMAYTDRESSQILAEQAFDRWLDERDARIIAAAEQRGAIKALRDAAGAIEKNNIVFDGDHYQPCNSCMSIHMNWLDYRADQEGAQDE